MPEVSDHYIEADILLPREDHMTRGHLVSRSRYNNRNVMGRSHTNSIFDTRMYQVEFAGGEVTGLSTDGIAESMYTQCNSKGNEYLFLDVLLYYHKDNKAISLPDQQTMV